MPLKKVFLCHSSSDKLFVDRLASDLEKVNIGVWYDKWEIKVGDSLIEKIQAGLENNDYLAVILSPESVKSEWVKKELNSALMKEIKEKKVVVLPCLLSDCSIPSFLSEKKYADFKDSYEDGFTDLLLAIFPESQQKAVIQSRDFRVVQYLISGLTNTDSNGSNLLNSNQLIKVYPFRKGLKGYLGLDEKRLLFYSAVAFKSANPETSFFINNNVPVWGLVDEVEDNIRAQWIVEGINQKVFGYMSKYFDWAIAANKSINVERVKRACLDAIKSLDKDQPDSIIPKQTITDSLRCIAKHDPTYFIDDFIKPRRINPGVIMASSELSEPLGDDFYLEVYNNDKHPETIASIIKALIKIKAPLAIQILSENYESMDPNVSNHEILNMLNAKEFQPALLEWLKKCSKHDDKVNIIAVLGNCGFDITDELNRMISEFDKIKVNNVALIRTIGCYGNKTHVDFLISKFGSKNTSVLNEAIIYAIGRLLKENSLSYIKNWYRTEDSNLVRAAALEIIAKYDTETVNKELSNIRNHQDNPYMLSAFIRAVEISKSTKWKKILPQLFSHPLLPIRLCAARSASIMSDYKYSMNVLDGKHNNIVKTVFDESLYCREPFRPDWLSFPYGFDLEIARLSFRLTWPDQPKVYLQGNLDTNRQLNQLLGYNEY